MLRQSKQGSSHQKKVQFNQSAKKVFTNDSIGTFSPGLYILYLLKLPAPPRAELSGIKLELVFSLRSLAELLRFATLPLSFLDEASQTGG